jgi:dimethylhistidine N-methyltransferase
MTTTNGVDTRPKRDSAGALASFREDVIAGLTGERKSIPSKYFYDAAGSLLFDAICDLPEYYLTRTELAIMQKRVCEMVSSFGAGPVRIVELGSGSSHKTRLLLEALGERCVEYVPVDIAREHMHAAARKLREELPHLRVSPVCADFSDDFRVDMGRVAARTVVYFPGSTIGNFHPPEARKLLARMRRIAGDGGLALVGIDLKKAPTILHAAYNDAQGATATFNRNVLVRVQRELGAAIDPEGFAHYAFYEPLQGRIEMHLVSLAAQTAHIGDRLVHFAEGESILTECSYKYERAGFARLAQEAGLGSGLTWTDPARHFAVELLAPRI